ncbi:Heterokaryon incompatibility [Macrophomina phaseolina MS6]|uniref:Heterokaryon incompatibility n=1 Tax=Macrophomina phaseolina (strain MS6) TaxID=1126212 RepID=K2R2C2_MACPH|nr:Heterokaryon incompatibility [Macrophomina phaseolina MS6]
MSSSKHPCRLCSRIFTHYQGRYSPWALLCSSYSGVRHTVARVILERSARAGCKLCRLLFATVVEADRKQAQVEDESSNGNDRENGEQDDDEVHFQFTFQKQFDNNTKNVQPVLVVSRLDTVFSRTLEFDVGTLDGDPLGEPQGINIPHVLSLGDEKVQFSLPVRKQTSDRGTRSIFQMVQGWVKSCDERPREPGSAHCCALNPTVPTRLIDVSGAPQKLRLINTGGKAHAPYAALSYCWGEAQPLLTTKHTLAQHKEDIPITKLPWTFLDAVKTAKWLNLKYIWIDALCIVQDSEEDREHEIARMQHVFQNSYVTIVAARASSCGDGFLKADNLWNPLATLPVRCEGGDTGNMLLTAKKGHQLPRDGSPLTTREPLHERGWTLQEVVLSPRVLIYTHDSIVWKCFCHDKGLVYNSLTGQAFGRDWNGYCASAGLTTMRLCPSGEVLQPSVTVTMPSFLLLDPSSQQPGGGSKLTRAQARLHQLYRIWEFLVQDYSTRRLTRPDDKLPALAGLATYFQRALNDVYIAGLWKGHFVHELCWTVDAKRAAALGGAERPESPWRAPSWSWMSIDGPVAFEANRHTLFESRIARFRCEVEPLTPGAPYSRLRSGLSLEHK